SREAGGCDRRRAAGPQFLVSHRASKISGPALCVTLSRAVRSVQLLKFDGYSAKKTLTEYDYIKSKWNLDGYDWEVHFFHLHSLCRYWDVVLRLKLLNRPRSSPGVKVNLRCRLVDPTGNLEPSQEKSVSQIFYGPSSCKLSFMRKEEVQDSGYLKNDSLTVQCTITVLKELEDVTIPAKREVPIPRPLSDLHLHLGELLQSQKGADVTFAVSGESFVAHKLILAARSPVFMAEFFGHMEERSSQRVEIEDMEAAVFKTMLHFIYTDTVPELDDGPPEAAATMAQHLLAAADRYGLDRLKLICEGKLFSGIDIDTAATTLALAEQHNCAQLRAKCVEFIAGSPETLDAVLATEGYKHLVASCPLGLTELLKAAVR
ncbi:hypothetical protein EJB05_41897, partial [Eragrostis curvula]